jgi:hypothetical protein
MLFCLRASLRSACRTAHAPLSSHFFFSNQHKTTFSLIAPIHSLPSSLRTRHYAKREGFKPISPINILSLARAQPSLNFSTTENKRRLCLLIENAIKKAETMVELSTTASASLSSGDFFADYKDNKFYYLLSTINLLHLLHLVSTFPSNLYIFICLDL